MENAPEHTAAVPAIRITKRLEPAACMPASGPTVLMRPSWMPKTNSRMRPLDSICLRFSSVGSTGSVLVVQLARGFAGFPVGGAQPAGAQRAQHAQRLLHAAADVHVAGGAVLDDTLGVDDVSRADRDAFLGMQDLIGAAYGLVRVAQQRIGDAAQFLGPGAVAFDGVDADAVNHRPFLVEVAGQLTEARDLGGADEGEIGGIEKQHEPMAAGLAQGIVPDLALMHSGQAEIGGGGRDGPHEVIKSSIFN